MVLLSASVDYAFCFLGMRSVSSVPGSPGDREVTNDGSRLELAESSLTCRKAVEPSADSACSWAKPCLIVNMWPHSAMRRAKRESPTI